jgi:hypothetical protein
MRKKRHIVRHLRKRHLRNMEWSYSGPWGLGSPYQIDQYPIKRKGSEIAVRDSERMFHQRAYR